MKYNVVGGGDSALYGVEPATFYLRNGFNNMQLLLPLALALPALAALRACGPSLCLPGGGKAGGGRGDGGVGRLLVAVAPVYVWGAAISALPHKEERFLYVVYPLVRARAGLRDV